MKIGFTGTRVGMTGDQAVRYARLVMELSSYDDENEFHFGLCVGADQQAAEIASWFNYKLIGHPGDVAWKWAGHMPPSLSHDKAVVLSSKPPLERDRDIVDVSDVLIATPKQQATPEFRADPSVRRGSGTWYTIRYAFTSSETKPIWFVWPDGTAVAVTKR